MKRKILAVIAVSLIFSASPHVWAAQYQATVLGKWYPTDINNAGQIVGYTDPNSWTENNAYLWQNGNLTDLGSLGGTYTVAYSVNNKGQVVGFSNLANGDGHAFLWQNGVITDLGTLGGIDSTALGINDNGQVVGWSRMPDSTNHAFLWENGIMTDLGAFDSGYSGAYGINNQGRVVGHSGQLGSYGACLWQNGSATNLGTFQNFSYVSSAADINDNNQVVGSSYNSAYLQRAFLWQNGEMTGLYTPDSCDSSACCINNAGQIVGWVESIDQCRAYLWQGDTATDLSGSYKDISANAINNNGWIVGFEAELVEPDHVDGQAILWTPVPEPTSLITLSVLLLAGVVGLTIRKVSLEARRHSFEN